VEPGTAASDITSQASLLKWCLRFLLTDTAKEPTEGVLLSQTDTMAAHVVQASKALDGLIKRLPDVRRSEEEQLAAIAALQVRSSCCTRLPCCTGTTQCLIKLQDVYKCGDSTSQLQAPVAGVKGSFGRSSCLLLAGNCSLQ
jgi:hypothetical protein